MLYQQVTDVAQPGLRLFEFLEEPGIGIGDRAVVDVGEGGLPLEVNFGVTALTQRASVILGLAAIMRGPGINQGA